PWMSLGDTGDLAKRVRCDHGYWDGSFLGLAPQPVDGAIGEPPPAWIVQERVAQAQHAWLLPPLRNARTPAGLVEWERSHDREPARVVPHRLKRQLRRARIPFGRMNDGGTHAAFVH